MVLTHIPLGDDTEDPVEGGKKGKGSKIVPKKDTWQYMFRLPGYMHCQVEGVGVVIQ